MLKEVKKQFEFSDYESEDSHNKRKANYVSKQLLNHLIIYTMIDTGIIISDKLIQEILNDSSLNDLIQKNWMGIDGIYAVIKNIFQKKTSEHRVVYNNINPNDFIGYMRQIIRKKTKKKLEIFKLSDQIIIQKMEILKNEIKDLGI